MKFLWLGRSFLLPFFSCLPNVQAVHVRTPEDSYLLNEHRDAEFMLCLQDTQEEHGWRHKVLRDAYDLKIPRAWWTLEDPNAYPYFIQNVRQGEVDFIFTSARECVERYQRRVQPQAHRNTIRVFWLPLAASPQHQYPLPVAADAADFVLVAQSYTYWPARRMAIDDLILPLLKAGHSLALFCPEDGWQDYPEIRKHRVGGETYAENCSEHYVHGRIALGINCQNGLPGDLFPNTTMTSMRTFETLACGKPLLAANSTAYQFLGFENGVHFAWSGSPEQTVDYAKKMLESQHSQDVYAQQGRDFVLANHTYAHRLQRISNAIHSKADPRNWR